MRKYSISVRDWPDSKVDGLDASAVSDVGVSKPPYVVAIEIAEYKDSCQQM